MDTLKYVDRYGARKELAPGDRITHGDGRTFTVKGLTAKGCVVRGGLVLYANIWKINGYAFSEIWH